jgi:hypothetical protein
MSLEDASKFIEFRVRCGLFNQLKDVPPEELVRIGKLSKLDFTAEEFLVVIKKIDLKSKEEEYQKKSRRIQQEEQLAKVVTIFFLIVLWLGGCSFIDSRQQQTGRQGKGDPIQYFTMMSMLVLTIEILKRRQI